MPRFVIQEHSARTHHFDFRLEKEGVFKSWAVPKGLPEEPGIKRLAIQVEDHPLAFGSFAGQIPKGQYGAGEIHVWDQGIYEAKAWSDDRIAFTLEGSRIHGDFDLVRFQHGRPEAWLILQKFHHTPLAA